MSLPTIYQDGKLTRVDTGRLTVWFSYVTPVAFQVAGLPPVVHENVWGKSTAAQLNKIDGGNKNDRVSKTEFVRQWEEAQNAA